MKKQEAFQSPEWAKIATLIFVGLIIGSIMTASLIKLRPFSSTISRTDCDQMIFEEVNNQSRLAYEMGVRDVSSYVLETGTLPVFLEDGSIQYLNLSKVNNG